MCDSHANALINIVYLSPSDAEDYLSNIFDVSNLIFFAFPKVGARYAVVDADVRIPWAVLSRSLLSAHSLLPIVSQLSNTVGAKHFSAPVLHYRLRSLGPWRIDELTKSGGREARRYLPLSVEKPVVKKRLSSWSLIDSMAILSGIYFYEGSYYQYTGKNGLD